MKVKDLIDLNEVKSALAVIKNADDILQDEIGLRALDLDPWMNRKEIQKTDELCGIVQVMAFIDIVESGTYDSNRNELNKLMSDYEFALVDEIEAIAQHQISEK